MVTIGMLGLIAVQYGTPELFHPRWGPLSRICVVQFQKTILGKILPPLSHASFALWFKIALGTAWFGYALALLASFRGSMLRARTILLLSAGVCITIAVLCPPALCTGPYGYVVYGRLQALYGLNPYAHSQMEINRYGDSTVGFLAWDMTCPYGPVWTALCVALVGALKTSGLWWQVVAFKLGAAMWLILSALFGRSITNHLRPGQGNLTLLAICLNPLFLLEGPGSGHQEMLMMGLLLLATLLCLRRSWKRGLLILGLSIGVKFVTIIALPWLVIPLVRGRKAQQAAMMGMLAFILALAPVTAFYAPFWDHGAPLKGMHSQSELGLRATASSSSATVAPSNISTSARVTGLVLKLWWLIAVYLGLTLWVALSKDYTRWTVAWIIVSGCLAFFVARYRFPWYCIWPWMVCLTQWNRAHVYLTSLFFVLALAQTVLYSVAMR